MHPIIDDVDKRLADRYGAYASFQTEESPVVEYYGEDPSNEVKRLLEIYARADSRVLDVGCGAGQTICQLAPRVKEIWGIDLNVELLDVARRRVEKAGLTNVTFVEGNVAVEQDVAQLPDSCFDVAFTERGPNMNRMLVHKLKEDAFFLQELVGNFSCYPLQEIFGRRHYQAYNYADQQVILSQYAELDLFPVSIKEYFYETFCRDIDHLEVHLKQSTADLSNWRIGARPYEAGRDRAALELYARYNETPRGIRMLHHRKVFVLRRAPVTYYPVDSLEMVCQEDA
jgi:SAM-dependent methyltransferase